MASLALRGVQCQRVLCGTVSATRQKHTMTGSGEWVPQELHSGHSSQSSHNIHQSIPKMYPNTEVPLPVNVEELQRSEKVRFSRKRSRDVSSAQNAVYSGFSSGFMGDQGSRNQSFTGSQPADSHIDVYDSGISVSLSSVMQTNVPQPFDAQGITAPGHLSMPGGGWAQDEKYVSGDLHDYHHTNSSAHVGKKGTSENTTSHLLVSLPLPGYHTTNSTTITTNFLSAPPSRCYSSIPNTRGLMTWCGSCNHNSCAIVLSSCNPLLPPGSWRQYLHTTIAATQEEKEKAPSAEQLTAGQKLQRAVKEYGSTVIVFHVTISLASLGICYLLVSSGVDMTGIIKTLGLKLGSTSETVASQTNSGDVSIETVTIVEQATTDAVSISEAGSAPNGENGSDIATALAQDISDNATAVAAGVSTFVVAYAVHKCFAPLRIAATLTATPFIVRHLRRIGVLKPPKVKVTQ
ncbi:unnamed protein product [Meganyctiphanes norvegica]|uniref:DUF1279 domain-containing protein n=1 Tax=Meganyctiphanes norvegica TaxID=48144 RepID=A0AAV2SK52_MEGNR